MGGETTSLGTLGKVASLRGTACKLSNNCWLESLMYHPQVSAHHILIWPNEEDDNSEVDSILIEDRYSASFV